MSGSARTRARRAGPVRQAATAAGQAAQSQDQVRTALTTVTWAKHYHFTPWAPVGHFPNFWHQQPSSRAVFPNIFMSLVPRAFLPCYSQNVCANITYRRNIILLF